MSESGNKHTSNNETAAKKTFGERYGAELLIGGLILLVVLFVFADSWL